MKKTKRFQERPILKELHDIPMRYRILMPTTNETIGTKVKNHQFSGDGPRKYSRYVLAANKKARALVVSQITIWMTDHEFESRD